MHVKLITSEASSASALTQKCILSRILQPLNLKHGFTVNNMQITIINQTNVKKPS